MDVRKDRHVRAFRLTVGCLVAGAVVATTGGCSDADGGLVGTANPAVLTNVSTHEAEFKEIPTAVPERVTVRRPALVDIDRSADGLPAWPGPEPSEFLRPSPPAGEAGELTGQQAEDAWVAAQNNVDELWNVNGVIVWLVVDPA